jgi:aldehyde dehydrogenase (NAD+)
VEKPVLAPFLERLVEKTRALRIGDPRDPQTQLGPAIDAQQLETTLRYVELGRSEGGRVVYGGERLSDGPLARGHFVRPAIVTGVAPASRLAQEEVFGPLLAVLEVEDFGEAVHVANEVRFGLSASICTRDLARALEYVQRAEAGVIMVNLPSAGIEYQIPFGGVKESSQPREQGSAAMQFYTETKTVYEVRSSVAALSPRQLVSGYYAAPEHFCRTAPSSGTARPAPTRARRSRERPPSPPARPGRPCAVRPAPGRRSR